MKDVRLYNLIFPLWLALFFPPYVFIILLGNLVIDGLVIYISLRLNKIKLEKKTLQKLILQAWGLGFLADIIGVLFLFLGLVTLGRTLELQDVVMWNSPVTIVFFFLAILISSLCIYFFNFWIVKKAKIEKNIAWRVALTMAIVTAPWLFLLQVRL